MPRFTFAMGNLRKIAALPLYALGRLASSVVPRQAGLWAFGSGTGVGEGALALAEFAREADPSLKLVWLARSERDAADARARGIASVPRGSWRGFRQTLRAQVIVVTHGFGDVNRFGTSGAFVVQLWHGIPFKRVHIDSPEAMRVPIVSRFGAARRAIRAAYERSGRGIGLFAVASERSGERIRSGFALTNEQIAVTGDPRDDVLLAGPEDERRARARDQVATLTSDERARTTRILLYAPTWRDGGVDPSIPSRDDWMRIAAYLEAADALLLIRSHPLGAGNYAEGAHLSDRVLFLGADLVGDITPLLPAVDTLITDYSSIAFDYALVGGEILFLAPDIRQYTGRRGVYEPYENFSGGTEVTTWADLVELLEANDTDAATHARLVGHAEWLARWFHAWHDGRNTERVYGEVLRRLAGEPPAFALRSRREGGATTHRAPQPATTDAAAPPPGRAAVAQTTIDELRITGGDSPVLELAGTLGAEIPRSLCIAGSRRRLEGEIDLELASERWSARVPLLSSRWRGPLLPPPADEYLVRILNEDERLIDVRVAAELPQPALYPELFRLTVAAGSNGVTLKIAAPLRDEDHGAAAQKRLAAEYRRSSAPVENAVFLESFFGQNASCNPRGIDRALAAARPEVTRYWAVTDASVEVPEGAVRVIEGSAEWWQARAQARLLVVNDWLRKRYRKHRGQNVLQTWHGTPLKRLALMRSGLRPRAALATFREQARWDLMLAQNDFSARIFRKAYAFRSTIWQEGYPRDDVLLTGDGDAVRERLGIAPGTTVVLYAPTWRDDRPGTVDHLDVARFARELGPGYVTLIRGHSRTLRPGVDVVAENVIDVTSYPEISELFLVADALVTDYSSVMFDFTVTGKPLYFFVPDYDHYRDRLRGFTFDLLPVAPGPVIDDPAELVRRVQSPEADREQYAERYAAWRARFNPRDDGHAGERVVRRLLAEGYLG
ncbi:CDP-glycerol glycerophosphotransferase family protein [Microbacterium sp. STN6]|uniref:CDP-glycerol glycerophosphotransferase family protein n=1 Tax=Microbacterium sp. STN6 TaxID=2995588 RepID=UPI002260E538|nr:CDP-glycerol glycerophosphotransferase family protein [Microbacterium sp. STN6]MCX7521979.1 CDP-glycerol glycerophosphotransferase family protein [Microbacterium sp. STN6]